MLPTFLSLSMAVTCDFLSNGSGSDMELGYDSNDEAPRTHYSLSSSPQHANNSHQFEGSVSEQHSYDEAESLNTCSSSNHAVLAMTQIKKLAQDQCTSGKQMRTDVCESKSRSNSEVGSNQDHLRTHQIAKTGAELSLMSHMSLKAPISEASSVTFHASGLGPWYAVIAYDACVRLCLNSWAKGGCAQAVSFLNDECKLLREAFSLRSTLLQSEEEVLSRQTLELVRQGAVPKNNKIIGKLKVHVQKVKMFSEPSYGCYLPHLPKTHLKFFGERLSKARRRLSHSIRNQNFTRKGFEYAKIGSQNLMEDSGSFCCLMRLQSSDEDDLVRMHPEHDETHIFFPDSLGDDLLIIVQDSKGHYCGRALVQITSLQENTGEKLRWLPIHDDPDHKPVGKIHLFISYSTSQDNSNHHKTCMVTETVAYDVVLETAMKTQGFQSRNLELNGDWKWLVTEFAAFYGVSDSYTKLRYVSYIMDIATPTSNCLCLVHDLLFSVISCGIHNRELSHKETRILGEVLDKLEQILSVVFENYKSLDESSCSGLSDGLEPPAGMVAPALAPAVQLYTLTNDVSSSEAQLKLCRCFQAAAKKRSRMHLKKASSMDDTTISTAYMKMKTLCLSMKDEIFTDKEIHNEHVLPSFLYLPSITCSIYSMDLQTRLCAFLKSYPPNEPTPPIIDLAVTLADFQQDISSWVIDPIQKGIDANDLFGAYISNWIKDTRLSLLASCVNDKACHTTKWPDVITQARISPFIDEIYKQLEDTINMYDVIISRYPKFALPLENAIADVQNALVEALDRNYADVLSPPKENPSRFGFKHVQRFTKRAEYSYTVTAEVGVLLNSMRRMLDALWPKIELHVKSWSRYAVDNGDVAIGESLGEATIMLRAKFRSYTHAIIEKVFNNTKASSSTKWRKIVEDLTVKSAESEIESRMEPLSELISSTLTHLHSIFETQVFLAISWGLWERFGKEVLYALEMSKENRSWYRGSRVALTIVDGVFASKMKLLVGNAVEMKDVKAPRSVLEAHSVLSMDFISYKDSMHYY